MLLKGAALTLLHYRDPGLRPMDDVDILVPTRQWRAAVDAVFELGWRPRAPVTPRHVEASHGMDFGNAEAHRMDLHWHLLPESCWPGADDEFWGHASTTSLHGVPVSILDPTDQLFHTCAHGVKWEPVPSLRWIVDAAMILKDPSVTIDWDRLLRLTDRHRVVPSLRDALTYLETELGLPVPAAVRTALSAAPVSWAEGYEYRLRNRPASPTLGRLREHWLRYRRVRRTSQEPDPIGFVGYLQVVLDCDGVGALARRALLRHRWRRQGRPVPPRRAAERLGRDPCSRHAHSGSPCSASPRCRRGGDVVGLADGAHGRRVRGEEARDADQDVVAGGDRSERSVLPHARLVDLELVEARRPRAAARGPEPHHLVVAALGEQVGDDLRRLVDLPLDVERRQQRPRARRAPPRAAASAASAR